MKKSKVYALCEGAIMVALATALSYVKLMAAVHLFLSLGLEAQLPRRVCLRSAPADL